MGEEREPRRPWRGPAGPPTGLSGLALLGAALVACAAVAASLLLRHRLAAGVAALVASACMLAGTVRAGQGGRRERLAALVMDRVFDAAVLVPLAWISRLSAERTAAVALFALGASFVASYERARGASLGYRGSEGVAYRATRAALLVLGLLTGWVEASVWVFLALALAAAMARAWNVAAQDRSGRVGVDGAG